MARTPTDQGKTDLVDLSNVTAEQYQLAAARRQHYDQLLWQTLGITLTAQAFLFQTALGGPTSEAKLIASALALGTAIAARQVIAKHRYLEQYFARLLDQIERALNISNISAKAPAAKGLASGKSVDLWLNIQLGFGIAAVLSFAWALPWTKIAAVVASIRG